ncbi:aldolase [Rhodococcus opacus]|nr:aldolase [Rhodococcus opacus]
MNECDARVQIAETGASLFARGYVHGTTGNISVKLEDGILITPTDACLGRLEPDEISKVDLDGEHVSGARPSKTVVLHRRIYASVPEAGCVIHTHSRELVAASLVRTDTSDLLPAITPYFVMKVGRVPHIPYAAPGAQITADRVQTAIESAQAHGRAVRAVMLERLGPNVWESSLGRAMAVLEELEETAYLWNRTAAAPLPAEAIAALEERFTIRW